MNQQSTYNNEIILKLKLIPTYAANSRPCANAELTILICLYILELITEIFKTCVREIFYRLLLPSPSPTPERQIKLYVKRIVLNDHW